MNRINDKGVTLIELIVSFAIVGVAIIYFFQTLYTVKKVYSTAKDETNEFVAKDYALRLLDRYIDENNTTTDFCGKIVQCSSVDQGADGVVLTYNINDISYGNSKTTSTTLYKPIKPEINTVTDETNGFWWDYFPGYASLTAKSNDLQVSYVGASSYYLGPFNGEQIELTLSNGVDCTGGEGYTYVYIVSNKEDVNSVYHAFDPESNNHTTWNQKTYSWNLNGEHTGQYYIYIKITHENNAGCTAHVALDSIKIN